MMLPFRLRLTLMSPEININIKSRGHKNSNPWHFHGIFGFSEHVLMVLMITLATFLVF
jgi:hypothetical protein